MKYFLFMILFLFSVTAAGGDLLRIKEDIKAIKLLLLNDQNPSAELIDNIQKELINLPHGSKILIEKFDTLKDLLSDNAGTDTLINIINEASDEFYKIYGEDIYNKIIPANRKKFILFTTSVSCECTIQMCRDYENAIYKSLRNRDNGLEFVFIDSFFNNSLTDKFNISFVPVLIILDESGTELTRFTREENILEILQNYVTGGKL
jgi:hypothetical protein